MNLKKIKSWLLLKATMIVALVGAAINVSAEEKFYLQDFSIEAGETKTLAIQFESDNVSTEDPTMLNWTAFQFDIYLPEGLTVAMKKGKYDFAFNEDRKDDHSLTVGLQSDGAIRVLSASLSNSYFWGTSGDFIYFTVTASEDFTGDHEIVLKEIHISDKSATRLDLPEQVSKVFGPVKEIAVSGIALDKTSAEMTEGESLTLVATVSPEDATDKTVTWSTSDASIATVENGVVTALKAGTVTITATAGDKTASCEITVKAKYVAVTGIILNKTNAELVEGENLTLVATVTPYNATDKTVTWSTSDSTVAVVSNGMVTALKVGTATITATVGDKTASCDITVLINEVPVTDITLNKTSGRLTAGESLTLVATVTPEDATDKTVTWSTSDASIATVDNGVVTALKAGVVTITASAGGKSATCKITVFAKIVAVSGITLDKTSAEMTEGESLTLVATVSPEDATDKTVIWSTSDASIATVENGVVTALKVGVVTITASAANKTASCEITVNAKVIDVTGITLDKTSAEMKTGESLTLVATVSPEDATDKTVTWSTSDASIATVENGVVTALKAGTVTITATAGDKTASCEITVVRPLPESYYDKFYLPDFSIKAGETKQLAIQFETNRASGDDPSMLDYVAFQFDLYLPEGLALVENNGKYDFAINENRKDDHTLTSALQPDSAIRVVSASLSNSNFWETSGDFVYFSVTASEDFAGDHEIALKTVSFSNKEPKRFDLDDQVCKVSGLALEDTTVAVSGITLDKTSAEMAEGESLTLVATVSPEDATDKTVTWSTSDASIATVENGVVTALKAGTATITATAGDKTASCEITVLFVPVSGIALDKTAAEIFEGETLTLIATVSPNNALNKTIVWSTSDASIATVENGVVTALKAGYAIITAESEGKTATCLVSVKPIEVEVDGITLDKTTAELVEGESLTLSATVSPDEATNKDITWSSSDESVATVVNGVVTALREGTAIITATAGNKTASCVVTVSAKSIAVESVTLDKTNAELTEGESIILTATVNPYNAADKNIIWSSSDESVATVVNGVVTAQKAGYAIITAMVGGKTATCIIIVNAIPTGIDAVGSERTNGNVYTINGQLVRKYGDSLNGLPRGIYIINGKKVLVNFSK